MRHTVKTKPGIISQKCEEYGISKKQLCSSAELDFRMIQKMDKGEFVKIIYLQRIVEFLGIPGGIVNLITGDKNPTFYKDLSGFVNVEGFNNDRISPIALYNLTPFNSDTWTQEMFRPSTWDSQFKPELRSYIVDDESISKELTNSKSPDDSLQNDLIDLEDELIKLKNHNFSKKENNSEVFRPNDFRMNRQLEKINSNGGISGIIRKLRDKREIFVSIGRYYFYEEEKKIIPNEEYPGILEGGGNTLMEARCFIPRGVILFVVSKIPMYVAQVDMGKGFPYYKKLKSYPGLEENDGIFTNENFVYLKEIRNGIWAFQNQDFIDMHDTLIQTNNNSNPTGIKTLNYDKNFEFLNKLSVELTHIGLDREFSSSEAKEKEMP